jgi:ATP-dependent helicase/DNAse subunit B
VPEENPVQQILKDAIPAKDGYLTVTPTADLNVFYDCSIKWLYQRLFKAEEFSLEASLLDDTALGILYHKILETVFARIKEEHKVFNSQFLDTYKCWALEITRAAIIEHPAFKGPLAEPLVSSQAIGMSKKIGCLLELEAQNFDAYSIEELELPVSLNTGDLLIRGIIDRVSISPNGDAVIIDYKTSYLPEQISPDKLQETPLSEFQIPLYTKLYEEKLKTGEGSAKINGAFFYSINGRRIKAVVGTQTGRNTKTLSREDYAPFLEATEKQIEAFGQKVKDLNLVPTEIRISDCFNCAYKTACRSTYFLNR